MYQDAINNKYEEYDYFEYQKNAEDNSEIELYDDSYRKKKPSKGSRKKPKEAPNKNRKDVTYPGHSGYKRLGQAGPQEGVSFASRGRGNEQFVRKGGQLRRKFDNSRRNRYSTRQLNRQYVQDRREQSNNLNDGNNPQNIRNLGLTLRNNAEILQNLAYTKKISQNVRDGDKFSRFAQKNEHDNKSLNAGYSEKFPENVVYSSKSPTLRYSGHTNTRVGYGGHSSVDSGYGGHSSVDSGYGGHQYTDDLYNGNVGYGGHYSDDAALYSPQFSQRFGNPMTDYSRRGKPWQNGAKYDEGITNHEYKMSRKHNSNIGYYGYYDYGNEPLYPDYYGYSTGYTGYQPWVTGQSRSFDG